jgi:protein-S-isoprenylcysteine O-methyltransferase Ste14
VATVEALNSQDITKVGVIVIVALVLIGALLSIVITAIVGRIIILVLVIAAGAFVWQQRTHVRDQVDHNCAKSVSFFGVSVDVPDSVRQKCLQVQGR